MFKNMKLATKMFLGFGTLVVLSAILGGISWQGLGGMSETADLDRQGSAALDGLNKCAALRRDFSIHGFEKLHGQEQNAAEKWEAACGEFKSKLHNLQSGLSGEKGEIVGRLLDSTEKYATTFGDQKTARTMRDEAFAEWGRVGWAVTGAINEAIENVIDPAMAAAHESRDPDALIEWANIRKGLDADVIEPFLLLRVCAVYLLATEKDAQYEKYASQLQVVKDGVAKWEKIVEGHPNLVEVVHGLRQDFGEYEAAGQQFYQGVQADRSSGSEMATIAGSLVTDMNALKDALKQDAEAIANRTFSMMAIGTVAIIVFGITLAIVITRSIVKPINRIIDNLNEGAEQVNDAAAQVSMASQQLAEGASEQASSLEETSSALEEMAAMTRTNAESARDANKLSDQARGAAREGDETMGELNSAMTGINDSSTQISKIIKVIEEIAFQTNLLALNAAVEAARAGEHGKGFAVVADEVRNLAQRAAQASGEVTQLIEESVDKARQGTDVAAEVGKALSGIVTDITQTADLVNNISQASEEQSQGVDQVNTAVSEMDKVTQQNAAAAEECASASEEMAAQATSVRGLVGELACLINGARNMTGVAPKNVSTPATGKPGPAKSLFGHDATVGASQAPDFEAPTGQPAEHGSLSDF